MYFDKQLLIPLDYADEFKDWKIVRNGGDGWRVEKPIAQHPNAEVQTNFVTSFR